MMTKPNTARLSTRPGFAALVLCMILLALSGVLSRPVQAAEWMEPYLEQVSEWGVMRGDASGNMHEDRQITRAEFVTLVNRAFGYTDAGPNPFTDVLPSDWFEEDIRIAHQAGYFNGTSATTASPRELVTREQAAAFLGRCLRLQGTSGAGTSFQDGYQITPQFRGLVQEAAELGIIQGYTSGDFRPKDNITRGQVACFLVRALGTLVQEPGENISGGVYGNLTINTPGVKLKDTVITGNLYLTGGVGLGNVELENVSVMGKIVVCGGGEAEKGANSIVLRNVTADSLEVDSLTEQFLSIRSEGLTNIGNTTIRTSAYIEDVTDDGLGLRFISLEGGNDALFQFAGNIKEVVNRTPGSTLQMAQGMAHVITVDEKALGTTLSIDNRASIKNLNLDTAVPVTGAGSVGQMNVNAAGSSSTMLPDNITVRPGITSNINGQVMDNVTAAESSEDPRLLTGFPVMRNVGPTAADAVFSTNKRGTIYWALTALSDGSVSEDDLIRPPTGSNRIIRSGTLNATASNTEFTARLTGLARDGSYYVSAMLVDSRGRRSPVKTVAFTTPDDSVPNFAAGYPYTILTLDSDKEQVVQVMAMPTKNCQMYYVLLPNNAVAPTAADFKAGSIPGNLGFGIVDVTKNTPYLVPKVNTSYLAEQTTYSLYLWLNDADNGRSSAVRRLQVTTLDRTPPVIQHLTPQDPGARNVRLSFSLNEPGTLYWAVVRHNAPFYGAGIIDPRTEGATPDQYKGAQIQIQSGTGALSRGSTRAARADTDYTINVTGLQPQTEYDLYYVAVDNAGNYNVYTQELTPPMLIHTLDNEPPTVHQEFSHPANESTTQPEVYPDTSISVVFSESVQGIRPNTVPAEYNVFRELYNNVTKATPGSAERAAAEKALADALREHIKLYQRPANNATPQNPVTDRHAGNEASIGDDWVIDYRKAEITTDMETGEMLITFHYNENPSESALNLTSGANYYITVEGISDMAGNTMRGGNRGVITLPVFRTIDAQVLLERTKTLSAIVNGSNVDFDMTFDLTPVTASSVDADINWDMLIWYTAPDPAASSVEFELFYTDDGVNWKQCTNTIPNPSTGSPTRALIQTFDGEPRTGISVGKWFANYGFEQLKTMQHREYGVRITKVGSSDQRGDWSVPITFDIRIVASDQSSLRELATPDLSPSSWENNQAGDNAVNEIGVPTPFTVTHTFSDSSAPTFIRGYPNFRPGDETANITVMLNRNKTTCYYVIAPLGTIPTTYDGENIDDVASWLKLEENGTNFNGTGDKGLVTVPVSTDIMNPQFRNEQIKTGNIRFNSGATDLPTITGLLADQEYIAYFVLRGESQTSYSGVYAFRFKTEKVVRPILSITLASPSATISADREADGGYLLVPAGLEPSLLRTKLDTTNVVIPDDYQKYWQANWYGMTYLQAMQTSVMDGPNSIGSVFDLFIPKTIQDEVASIIISGSAGAGHPGSLVLRETSNITTDLRFTQDYSRWMDLGVPCWLIAVASSPQGSSYAFCANYPLTKLDTEHPKLQSMGTSMYTSSGALWFESPAEAMQALYYGSLTIQFDEDLNWKTSSTSDTWLELVNTQSTVVGPGQIHANALLSAGQNINLIPDSQGKSNPLNFQFGPIAFGSTITLRTANLCDSAGNAGFTDGNLMLQLELVQHPVSKMYSMRFVVSSASKNWLADGFSYDPIT